MLSDMVWRRKHDLGDMTRESWPHGLLWGEIATKLSPNVNR
jgi:hypothetical protein